MFSTIYRKGSHSTWFMFNIHVLEIILTYAMKHVSLLVINYQHVSITFVITIKVALIKEQQEK